MLNNEFQWAESSTELADNGKKEYFKVLHLEKGIWKVGKSLQWLIVTKSYQYSPYNFNTSA